MCDQNITKVLAAVRQAQKVFPDGVFNGLSFSHNSYFKDGSLLQVLSFFEKPTKKNRIKNLHLERVNCSATALFRFCRSVEALPADLHYINLGGNNIPYFCVDGMLAQKRLPKYLDLSDTRMDDLTAFHLVSGLVKHQHRTVEVSLARNPLLSFAFFTKLSDFLASATTGKLKLKLLNLQHCTISEQC